jgi:hypothetical protein
MEATMALKWIAIIVLSLAIVFAALLWYSEQRYKDCLYVEIGTTQANNTGSAVSNPGSIFNNKSLESVQVNCSRSLF